MAYEHNGQGLVAFVARVVAFYNGLKKQHDADVARVLEEQPDRVSARRPIDARQRLTRYNMRLADGLQVPMIAIMDFLQEQRQSFKGQNAPARPTAIIDQKIKVPRKPYQLIGYCTQTVLGNFAEFARRTYRSGKERLSRHDASRMKNFLHDFVGQQWVEVDVPYEDLNHVIGGTTFTYLAELTADPDVKAEAQSRAYQELRQLGDAMTVVEGPEPDLRQTENFVARMLRSRHTGRFKPQSWRKAA